ncbi:ATP-binding cassette domain-containing protein [Rhizobium sp. SSA_523]|uniref:ABC transporter ATP-binding protein n=1 Tax=Rhizobium sp. SSA_523 TaxID=2952477 RepID=UPI002091C80B|nr:ATP-binding cassette domain-containing protein [Rhizobium sp. SSA_523]MCO5733550.1 ATP-binding cassette domain-containing protein [Rhizobium sp. SSA_523]WKC23147.1 ATP-binding cassette domain-containing protein [Rhizobium sp. SSA_523]
MTSIISAASVSKTFRQRVAQPGLAGAIRSFVSPVTRPVRAVEDISFDIAAGEAVGYLGPNGAGKSTMIKMLTGILAPTSGRVTVLGRHPQADRVANARNIGVVFGQRTQLWWELPLFESFELHRRMYRVPDLAFSKNCADLTEMMGLASFLERPVRHLSLGQRMRAEIAMALMHDPKILFLDEPTIGLDVVAKDVVRKFLARINRERGTTIILTTHDLQDIEEICPRLIMVDEGRLLFDGPVSALRTRFGARRKLTVEFVGEPGMVHLPGAEPAGGEGNLRMFLLADDDRSLVELLAALQTDVGLRDVRLHEPGIEEIIRTHYQARGLAGRAA